VAACVYCHGRKGKRDCPALAGKICAACCGEHRRVDIHCPDDCAYLGAHEGYQQERMLDRVPRAWMGRLVRYEEGGGPALEILHTAQLSICFYAAEGRPINLASARDGIEFARRRMSLIETPEPLVPPFGEFLLERLDGRIEAVAGVDRSGIRDVLEELLRFLEYDVTEERFADLLEFLRAIYAPALAATASSRPAPGSGLILPG